MNARVFLPESRYVLGCPKKLPTMVSKLVYLLRDLQPIRLYLYRSYNPFTEYHEDPGTPLETQDSNVHDSHSWRKQTFFANPRCQHPLLVIQGETDLHSTMKIWRYPHPKKCNRLKPRSLH